MKKTLLSLSLLVLTFMVNAQSFTANYSFSLVTASSGTLDPTPTPTVTGATFGSFMAVGTPANPNAPGYFSFLGWTSGGTANSTVYSSMTGSITLTKFYEVTITPQSGFNINFNTIVFTSRRSAAGIRSYAVRSNLDGYASNLPASVTNTILSIEGSNEFFINQDATATTSYTGNIINLSSTSISSPITFRFYGWNNETGGSFALDDVIFTGTAVVTSTCQSSPVSLAGKTDATCNGLANGSATVTATNNGPFTYTWMPSGGSAAISTGLSAGLYTCAVTNSCGAVSNQTVLIGQPNQIILSANFTPIICNGGTTSVTVSATGGTTPYMYMPGSNTVTAGSYTYVVMDNNNCMASKSITVANPLAISKTQTITLCAGQTATIGTSTYSASGSYTNVLMAANGCDSTVYSTINVLNAIDGSVSLSGQVLIANQSGANYQWIDCNNGNAAIPSATMQSYAAVNNGNYAVMITMGNCSITSTCIAVNSVTCSVPTLSVTGVTNVTCFGLANGSATISATNNGPFTYTWMPSTNSTNIATGLSAGLYTCAVTNSCGVVSSQTVLISEPNQLTLSANYAPILCAGGVASVTVSANGGTPAYMYTPSSNTVAAGNYTYMVMDANNCMASKSITVANPLAISKTQTITLCAGQTATVGTSTYSASGSYTNVLMAANGCDSTVYSTINVLNAIDGSVSLSGQVLIANQSGANYQWIDCNNGNAAIPSATNQAFTIVTNGSYAVMVTLGNCSTTSTCTPITTVGLQKVVSNSNIKIYPNPTNGILNIIMKDTDKTGIVKIVNSIGLVVFESTINKENNQINIQHLAAGLYFVQMNSNTPVRLIKD